MPVQYIEAEGRKWFRFARGTACNGVDYNPDEVGQIDARWATIFDQQGRGQILTAEEAEADIKARSKGKSDGEDDPKGKSDSKPDAKKGK